MPADKATVSSGPAGQGPAARPRRRRPRRWSSTSPTGAAGSRATTRSPRRWSMTAMRCSPSTLPATRKALDADDGECLYVVGELTDLAQTAQRQLDLQTYLPPILAGTGEGATFAYAALADAPANTLGGAVAGRLRQPADAPSCRSVPAPPPRSRRTARPTATASTAPCRRPPRCSLRPTRSTTSPPRPPPSAWSRSPPSTRTIRRTPSSRPCPTWRRTTIRSATCRRSTCRRRTDPRALAILVSGDGGWRDLDKTMGEWLSTKGVHVVGLDALHYFWSKRTPQQLATRHGAAGRRRRSDAPPARDADRLLVRRRCASLCLSAAAQAAAGPHQGAGADGAGAAPPRSRSPSTAGSASTTAATRSRRRSRRCRPNGCSASTARTRTTAPARIRA